MSDAPFNLKIALAPRRPVAVGQEPEIHIVATALRPITLVTVGLNDGCTRVRLVRVNPGHEEQVFSSRDHRELHEPRWDRHLGFETELKAGQRKRTDRLRLWDYMRPLEPGRYEVQLSYLYDRGEECIVDSNVESFDVVAADYTRPSFRWFLTRKGRDQLESLWLFHDGQQSRLLFTASHPSKLDVLKKSILVRSRDAETFEPCLAQLNAILYNQPNRWVVWVKGTQVAWLRTGVVRGGDIFTFDTALDAETAPRLVDPPLQRRHGRSGACILLLGQRDGVSTLSLLDVDGEDAAEEKQLQLSAPPVHGVVVWSEVERDGVAGAYYWVERTTEADLVHRIDLASEATQTVWRTPGRVERLIADESCGRGFLYALTTPTGAAGEPLRVQRWALDETNLTTEAEFIHELPLRPSHELGQVVTLYDGAGVAAIAEPRQPELHQKTIVAANFEREIAGSVEDCATCLAANKKELLLVRTKPGSFYTFERVDLQDSPPSTPLSSDAD